MCTLHRYFSRGGNFDNYAGVATYLFGSLDAHGDQRMSCGVIVSQQGRRSNGITLLGIEGIEDAVYEH